MSVILWIVLFLVVRSLYRGYNRRIEEDKSNLRLNREIDEIYSRQE